MNRKIIAGVMIIALTVGMTANTLAEEEESEVTVAVDDTTQLDVKPDELDFTDDDGLETGETRTVSDSGYEHIEVENIGSDRIGSIYAQGTMPVEQPFGTTPSDEVDHDTGNFVLMSLETADDYGIGGLAEGEDTLHYLNRVEYFEDNPPTYIETSTEDQEFNDDQVTVSPEDVYVGRFRVGAASYFFAIYEADTEPYGIRVANTPETATTIGTSDFTDEGSDYTEYTVDGDDEINDEAYQVESQSFVTIDEGTYEGEEPVIDDGDAVDNLPTGAEEERQYNLYYDLSSDSEFVIRTRYNVEQQSPDFDGEGAGYQLSDQAGTGSQLYILDTGDSDNALQPGENFPIDFGVEVPLGTDHDNIEPGTVTVIAESLN